MIFHQPWNSLSNYNYNANFYTDIVWEFHFHKNFELIYVINGTVHCTINGTAYHLTSGDFGLCLPYDIHRYEPGSETCYWVLVFSEDFVHAFAKQITDKTGSGFIFRPQPVTREYLITRLVYGQNPTIYTLKSCLYAICDEYLNTITLVDKDKTESEIISLIADYIFENHRKKITLSDIARKLGYDYNYMSRYFRNVFNMPFTEFVNIYRLETAILLLENTDKNIISVAEESGFQSTRTFNHFFRKNVGTSPTEYRKNRSSRT